MTPRQHPPNSPTPLQTLLAALTGVSIGLLLTNFYKHQPLRAQSAQVTPPAQTALAPQAPPAVATTPGMIDFSNFNLWPRLDERMNVLLMGVDSNGRDTERFTGCRSDTMMIASLDPKTHKVALVSLPRDSRVRIADNHGVEKINAAHALGGPELAVKTVSEDFGVPIDHYIVIDTQGLKKVFEALGPVDVLVEKPMHYRDRAGRLNIALEPGVVSMDANKLEEYVRFRHDAKGDIGRIERQQWFMRQVKKKLEEPQVLLKLPELFKLAGEHVRTDLSVEDMAKLASFSKDIKPSEIQTAMLPGVGTFIAGGSYWLPDAENAAIVLHRLTGSPLATATIARTTGSSIRTVVNRKSDQPQSEEADGSIGSTNDSVNAALAASYTDKPLSVVVRYPRGGEELAKTLSARLEEKGLTVKYRQRGESAECAHEQIIETSYRADDNMTAKLKDAVGELAPFAVSLNLDPRAAADFVVVISSTTTIAPPIASATPAEGEEAGNGGVISRNPLSKASAGSKTLSR
ncbi:MAG: LCP family protein [Cyanobacteria bacterium SZAS LIN-3]|nr:LCP family protein [Cyanobacteria bacterium SZAS LIN-3]